MSDPIIDLVEIFKEKIDVIILACGIVLFLSAAALMVSNPDKMDPVGFIGSVFEVKDTSATPHPLDAIIVSGTPRPTQSPTPTPPPALLEFNDNATQTNATLDNRTFDNVTSPVTFENNSGVFIAPMPGDTPFYEAYLHPEIDYKKDYLVDQPAYDQGTSNLILDISNSYLGRSDVYPGDTIGMKLRVFNKGPDVDELAKVTVTVDKKYTLPVAGDVWLNGILTKSFVTPISVGSYMSTYKNLSYTIPQESSIVSISGYYRVNVNVNVAGGYLTFIDYIYVL